MRIPYLIPSAYETHSFSVQQVVPDQEDMVCLGAVSRSFFCRWMRGDGAVVFFSAATPTASSSSFGYAANRQFARRGYVRVSSQREWNVEHKRDVVGEWDERRFERRGND